MSAHITAEAISKKFTIREIRELIYLLSDAYTARLKSDLAERLRIRLESYNYTGPLTIPDILTHYERLMFGGMTREEMHDAVNQLQPGENLELPVPQDLQNICKVRVIRLPAQ
jgi:hypothetical protein